MQINYVSIGGAERPFCFSHALAYHYELTTGKSYLRELDALFQELAQVAARLSTDNVGEAAKHMSVVRLVDLLFSAHTLGARKERISVDFDVYQFTEWLMADQDVVGTLCSMLVDANIDPGSKSDDEKKRMTTTMIPSSSKKKTAK